MSCHIRPSTEGRVTFVPKAGGDPGRFVEVEGGPDLVVLIVGDSSVKKDTRRLPGASDVCRQFGRACRLRRSVCSTARFSSGLLFAA